LGLVIWTAIPSRAEAGAAASPHTSARAGTSQTNKQTIFIFCITKLLSIYEKWEATFSQKIAFYTKHTARAIVNRSQASGFRPFTRTKATRDPASTMPWIFPISPL
jgi:hypothetical protein